MMFQFHIQLLEVEQPAVWRRVALPATASFFRFHKAIQVAFGWEQAHLFQFSPGMWGTKPVIGLKSEDDEPDMVDCKKLKLRDIFSEQHRAFTYIYDFGDTWVHAINLEKVLDSDEKKAQLLDGGGKCPPEDCGGPWGYMDLKKILADKKHPDYYDMREWMGLTGKPWKPDSFDMAKAKKAVNRI